ncbi:hypothetical protein [Bradyrhizobium brasilense]|uniref:hypothetical protein n=1 Tax=Bradyrhizobium brasilense TaxID=1419277 RepID=UPI001E46D853|nr:hypothetical protein [Bradyrhizobium brasilense]MCC8969121.1 hypothetical protein [Bradyrhizobium brasilense]
MKPELLSFASLSAPLFAVMLSGSNDRRLSGVTNVLDCQVGSSIKKAKLVVHTHVHPNDRTDAHRNAALSHSFSWRMFEKTSACASRKLDEIMIVIALIEGDFATKSVGTLFDKGEPR